jgi:hypothetical protein
MIQGKSGRIFTVKATKKYQGSSSEPLVTPAQYYARYFLDDHTEVGVLANVVDWPIQDFTAMLASLKITTPQGYY